MTKKILTDDILEPLNGATTAMVDIIMGDGNLEIDPLTGGEQVLASGTLEYLEKQGLPMRSLQISNGQATLKLKTGLTGRPWLHFPWSACNGATDWWIHLNPVIPVDITAHSGGGNVKLNLAGMAITHLSAETGGGNLDIVLPVDATDLNVSASTGGGNVHVEVGGSMAGSNIINATTGAGKVVVHIPSGIAARIHTTTGWGKTIVDPQFSQIDKYMYQSSEFDRAANKVEINVKSGAGDVCINAR